MVICGDKIPQIAKKLPKMTKNGKNGNMVFSIFSESTLVIIRLKNQNQTWLYRGPYWIFLYLKFLRHILFGNIDPNEGLGAKIGEIVKMSISMAIMSGLSMYFFIYNLEEKIVKNSEKVKSQ